MPIRVHCPACQAAYNCPDDRRGADIRCLKCGRVFRAGAASPGRAPGPVCGPRGRRARGVKRPPRRTPPRPGGRW